MAKHTVIQMTDDLDGSEATQSVEFSFRGKSYTIDLNDANASDFDDAVAPYIAAAEKSGSAQPSRGSARRAPRAGAAGPSRGGRRGRRPPPRPPCRR